MIGRLIEEVQAMARGDVSEEEAQEGFSFETWLAKMVEEGVHLETA